MPAPTGRRWRQLGFQLIAALLCALALPSLGMARGGDPWAPFDTPWFDRLGVADGLPHSITTALQQDRRGLVWIGTLSGLVRYDGYRMQVFTGNGSSKNDIPDAYVRCLLTLPDGSLLIGTNAGGLSRFNPFDNSFHNYPVGRGGTSDRKIYAMALDGNRGVWIATDRGIDYLELHSDRITATPLGAGMAARSFSILQDRAGNLWVGNNSGLFERAAGSKTFARSGHATSDDVDAVLNDGIWALREDREGRLWAGSTQSGAAWRDDAGHWHAVAGFSGLEHDHSRRPTVRAFNQMAGDTMWMATDGGGVLAYDVATGHLNAIVHDTAMPSSLPGDSLRDLLRDSAGNIWVATDLGVARYDPGARKAFALLPSTNADRALANANVRGIFVDSRQRIWLALGSGRVDVIDLAAATIRHLELGGAQTHRDVQAFAEMPDGSIWVGAQGLAVIDPATFAIRDSAIPELDDKPVLHLLSDGPRLLIATYDGVYRYDTHTRTLTHFTHDANDPDSLASDTVRRIAHIGDDIWYVTGRGISIATSPMQNRGFRNLLNRPGDATSLPNNLASSIAMDPQGNLLVGTYGGLAILQPRSAGDPYRFTTIGTANGLPSANINAVQPDDYANPWVSLPNGLAMIDGNTHAVHNLGVRDGLRIASYIYAASARAPDGELMFGGLGGLTVVRPAWQPPDEPDAALAITYAAVNGAPLAFGKLPRPGESLRINARNRSLRVDFALLDYDAPSETSYSYRLQGYDEDWVEIPRGSLPTAIYTNLPHGDYKLHLRAQTHGMQPRLIESNFDVSAEPRWYETVAALVVAGLLALTAIVAVIQLRTLYLRRQARHLQQQVELRTQDLLVANKRLDELANTDALTGACNRRRVLELAEEVRAQSPDGQACIALLDLDRFKRINDTYGHLAGDAVIRHACRVMQQHGRDTDAFGRYGGEELLACLPGSTLEQGMVVAERIRSALADEPLTYDGHTIAITVSIGVAAYRAGETLSQWLTRADGALYEAKHGGRNRSVAAR
ncbi:ligand-binding sensor domain-containing diguanylate cyclase [Dyella japonica]|uniref:diguanylate cyclase n=1 Tax=Dyella japonica A8 TaxID=1217721 RepID=A0A075K2T3_9GAMM|nr:ligand-binding sensor domain-containing diguanylate cyclase [Dyella japonica]AIF48300.1 diguanylate cyclase [Dyella japonica A8]